MDPVSEDLLKTVEPSRSDDSRTPPQAPLLLRTIFQNPVLLSSFLQNFERKDYTYLAQLAASISDLEPWPKWNPLTEPWPQGKLTFDIQDLHVECNDQRVQLRHLVDRGEGHRPEDARWAWVFDDDADQNASKKCQHTEKSQGLRPKPGPNPGKVLEKKPIEILECVGHRLRLADCPNLGFHELYATLSNLITPTPIPGNSTKVWSPDVTLADTHGAHEAGFMVCSDCANSAYNNRNYCLWKHERMIPLCKDCSETPDPERLSYQYDSTRPSIHDNILKFTRGEDFFECTCYTAHSPANGFHLCSTCSGSLDRFYDIRLYYMMGVNVLGHTAQLFFQEADSLDFSTFGRNKCVCGKEWGDLVASWNSLSPEERDKKLYRLCLVCTGHVPRKSIVTARPTNCI
ncbi:hypothetical protein H2200_003261 [Cladophialophora chaetospira]|uniref:Uncharacterized protein n=1 Tax=Cladophialophora chaetospira TaxID=386627 RepID=A0AA38XH37_9EURO|nr:hypothetical protein H2200_003261 [Cladophialophora chaetospira]